MNSTETFLQTAKPQVSLLGQLVHEAIKCDIDNMRTLNQVALAIFNLEAALKKVEKALQLQAAAAQAEYFMVLKEDMRDE